MKKKFKFIKSLICAFITASFLPLNTVKPYAMPKQIENSNENGKNNKDNTIKKATPYTKEEIETLIDNNWAPIEAELNSKQFKHFCILGAGGAWGLCDPYLYSLADENEKRKMNDSAYLLMYAIPKYLDKDIAVLFVNGADNTIKILSKDDSRTIPNALPNIPTNSEGKYDKYYGGHNQMWAVHCLTEKIAKLYDAVADWEEVLDPVTDDPVIDKETGNPVLRAKKLCFAPKIIAHMSLQTNENDLGNGEGMELYYNANDNEGKDLSEKIAKFSKYSFVKKPDNNIKSGEPIFATTKKIITRLGDFGVPTTINFFDYTDNIKNQYKFFDSDAIERAAMNIARGINCFFNIDNNFANIEFEPVHNEKHDLKYVKIKILIQGYDTDNIKKCSIAILNAENKDEITQPEKFKQDLNIKGSEGSARVTAEFKFVPKQTDNVKDNCDTRRGVHNKYYIKLWQENENESILIPSDVTNFELLQINPWDEKWKNNKEVSRCMVEVHPNAVYQKNVQQSRKDIPEWFEGTPEYLERLKKIEAKNKN